MGRASKWGRCSACSRYPWSTGIGRMTSHRRPALPRQHAGGSRGAADDRRQLARGAQEINTGDDQAPRLAIARRQSLQLLEPVEHQNHLRDRRRRWRLLSLKHEEATVGRHVVVPVW